MHWKSHCEAFYAQWMVRYLHPRKAPWKQVADHWLSDDVLGRSVLVAKPRPWDELPVNKIPSSAPYLQRCLVAFQQLQIKQNRSLLSHHIQAEPLWNNWRFQIDLPQTRIQLWTDEMETAYFLDLIDREGTPFDENEWRDFFADLAPDEPEGRMMDDLDRVFGAIGEDLWEAAEAPPESDLTKQIVAIINYDTHEISYAYAEADSPPQGQEPTITYHDLWLDTSNRPHRTGNTIDPTGHMIAATESWDDTPTEPPPTHGSEALEEIRERRRRKEHAIIGPAHRVYPRNLGWRMKGQKGAKNGKHRKLSDLTIHDITDHLTSKITKNVQPNCIENWKTTTHGIKFDVNFDLVFGSFGTELSDATEERQWRKYIHRALNVRNRNPHLEDKKCRLCGVAEESMLHLVECMHCKPLWKKCLAFCRNTLDAPNTDLYRGIIFNQENYDTMLPEAACAFIRHAFNIFYHDFANVEKGFMFIWQRVYYRALTSFRSAVRRYSGKIRLQHTHRLHTSLTEVVSEDNRKKFTSVVSIDQQGNSTLSTSFTAAIDQAYSDLKAEENRRQPRRV